MQAAAPEGNAPASLPVLADEAVRAAALEADSLVGAAQQWRDTALLRSVVDSAYRGTRSNGTVVTRAALLRGFAAGPRYESWAQVDREVHVRGDQVAVAGTVVATVWRGRVQDTVHFTYTRVYEVRPGGLRMVGGLLTSLADGAPPPAR